jgi:hypothetical protein
MPKSVLDTQGRLALTLRLVGKGYVLRGPRVIWPCRPFFLDLFHVLALRR